jgi:7,8-dihydropterin-6-yl-methyl-4-(beta-D-ribofuranosyl)aminobenzene 5'-phosphate synthase
MSITVVYDNNAYDPRLRTAWGFACLIERGETTILFDTGGDGGVLLSNMAALDLEPRDVDLVVLSHIHGDHTGGLSSLLAVGAQPTVYVPRSFPARFKARVRAQTDVSVRLRLLNTSLVEVGEAVEITDGVYTSGGMGSGLVEQALVLSTAQGLVVVTGCAHPGVVEMVRRAKEVGGDEVYLVLGGFHLGGASGARVQQIITDFRRLGVQKVAPCHCTGDRALGLFREAYGEDFIRNGAGKVLVVD